ncbi:MAG: hypothetical protein ACM3NO_06900 [Deltaproteobacteria bacterium]
MNEIEGAPAPEDLSKRAARRLIQRAFVLLGRNKQVRQHLREVHAKMQWVLADADFEWAVLLDKGKVQFDRRPVKNPDITLTWARADVFFESARTGRDQPGDFSMEGRQELRRLAEMLWRALRDELGNVLRFPIDDDGVRLA